MTREKQQLHELVDQFAPGQVPAVRGLLQAMLDPVSRASADARVDGEPLTAEEAQALDEAREWLKHNRPIPHEQVLAELGITQEEIENHRARGDRRDVRRFKPGNVPSVPTFPELDTRMTRVEPHTGLK